MKSQICLALLMLCLCLCGCESGETVSAPTESPLTAYVGQWTEERGDGGILWQFREDGTVLVPMQAVDPYRELGGLGTWTADGETLSVRLGEPVSLEVVTEDGFVKLYCPLLNLTLVRAEEREQAFADKYVEVELTDENLWEYFHLEQVPAPVDEQGERIYKELFVMRSSLYEDGWVFWGEEAVELRLTYWTTYELRTTKAPFGVNFYVDTFQQSKARGTLLFVKADHVAEYSYTGHRREVCLQTGEGKTEDFEGYRYAQYPY